jgi:hypothetical protein
MISKLLFLLKGTSNTSKTPLLIGKSSYIYSRVGRVNKIKYSLSNKNLRGCFASVLVFFNTIKRLCQFLPVFYPVLPVREYLGFVSK